MFHKNGNFSKPVGPINIAINWKNRIDNDKVNDRKSHDDQTVTGMVVKSEQESHQDKHFYGENRVDDFADCVFENDDHVELSIVQLMLLYRQIDDLNTGAEIKTELVILTVILQCN